MSTRSYPTVIIIVILLLSAATRLHDVDTFPLSTDEGWSINFIDEGTIKQTIINLVNDRHPPAYYLVLTMWQHVAGMSHFALRFVSVAGGILSVALTYRISTDWFSKRTGLFAAAFLSVLDIAIYYSQELRHYGWLLTGSLIVTLLFLRLLARPRRNLWIAYGIAVALLMYTHYFGFLIMLVHVVYGLVLTRQPLRHRITLIFAWIGAFVLYIPWMFAILKQFGDISTGVGGFPNSFTSTYSDVLIMLNLLSGGQLALLGGLIVVGLVGSRQWTIQRLAIVGSGIGLFVFMLLINIRVGLMSARMIVFLTPYLMIICATGLERLNSPHSTILITVSMLVSLSTTPIIHPRANQNEMVHILEKSYSRGDLIILETGWTDFATGYEINQKIYHSAPQMFSTVELWNPERIIQEAEQQLAANDSVWLVHWIHAPTVLTRLLDGWMGFKLVDSFTIENPDFEGAAEPMRLYLFQKPEQDRPLLVFGDRILLYDAFLPDLIEPDEILHVDLWWRAEESLERDYSVNLFLTDAEGTVITDYNVPIAELPSSQWSISELLHARYDLAIPDSLSPGTYTLNTLVYYYEDPGHPLQVNGAAFVRIGEVIIRAR